jgi:hypothetical protein
LAPPYLFSDGEFYVSYRYSFFSHLNERMFLATLGEVARIVRMGGFVIFTTLRPSEDVLQPIGFPETWRADAAAGRFIHCADPHGDNSELSSVWGWAHVSEPYLRRIISDFPLKLVAYQPDRLAQAFVALQKQ